MEFWNRVPQPAHHFGGMLSWDGPETGALTGGNRGSLRPRR